MAGLDRLDTKVDDLLALFLDERDLVGHAVVGDDLPRGVDDRRALNPVHVLRPSLWLGFTGKVSGFGD